MSNATYTVRLSKDRKSVIIAWDDKSAEYGVKSAEYGVGSNPKAEISAWRRVINNHLRNGGTMGNYQW
jgi:hypothetical protein